MTPEELAEGRRLLAEATGGPWAYVLLGSEDGAVYAFDGTPPPTVQYSDDDDTPDLYSWVDEHAVYVCQTAYDGKHSVGQEAEGELIAWALNHLAELLDIAVERDELLWLNGAVTDGVDVPQPPPRKQVGKDYVMPTLDPLPVYRPSPRVGPGDIAEEPK